MKNNYLWQECCTLYPPVSKLNETVRFHSRLRFSSLTTVCIFILGIHAAFAQAPTITSFSLASGAVGTTVTITGTNFNATAGSNVVLFGATKATVTAATTTQLTVTVPVGASYGPIIVLNASTSLLAYSSSNFTPTFTPNTPSSIGFAANADFGTGDNPLSVAIGDLDGDGRADLVTANYGSFSIGNTVTVLRNTSTQGSVSFSTKADFRTGSNPEYIAIGDLDGDGRADLAVANYFDNTVSVLRNTSSPGSISFATKLDFGTGGGPSSVAIGDLDGDGRADITVSNYGSNTVSVLRNTSTPGSIGFAAKADFGTGSGSVSVAIGDLDGDGRADLAVANYASGGTVSVLRNTGSLGTANFAAKADFGTGGSPSSVSICDLDGDGRVDLAIASFASNIVSVLRNTGSLGTTNFADKADFGTGDNPLSVSIGDLDGDGRADLVTANYSNSKTVSVLRNNSIPGSIGFATKTDFGIGAYPKSVSICDLDGDGKADLAVANNGNSGFVSVIRNNPPIITAIASPTLNSPVSIYPNPSTEVFTVKLPEDGFTSASYQVIDLQGKVIASGSNQKPEFSLSLKGWNAGTYILKVDCNGKGVVRQIVKE